MRSHLEDVLTVARFCIVDGFNLLDSNDPATNMRNFKTATRLSAYLHRYDNTSGNGVSLFINYMVFYRLRCMTTSVDYVRLRQ